MVRVFKPETTIAESAGEAIWLDLGRGLTADRSRSIIEYSLQATFNLLNSFYRYLMWLEIKSKKIIEKAGDS